MDIVEQCVKLADTILQLEHQATAIPHDLMRTGSQVGSTHYEGVAHLQADRVFNPEFWPPPMRNDRQVGNLASGKLVDVRPVAVSPAFVRPEASQQVDLLRYRC
ncbi:MAG: hypothetical protein H7245_20170 [Candidatus Saccharibacteria bacterium]|nr:hypothetical protein [Pseudorhodobacter sp.]